MVSRSAHAHVALVCVPALQCVAVCCSVLRCGAVCCSVLQRVAVCCNVLQCVAAFHTVSRSAHARVAIANVLVSQCVTVRCSVLQGTSLPKQCVAVLCCSPHPTKDRVAVLIRPKLSDEFPLK